MHILELAPPSLRDAVILDRKKKGLVIKTLRMAITATESKPEWVVKRLALASHVAGATLITRCAYSVKILYPSILKSANLSQVQ